MPSDTPKQRSPRRIVTAWAESCSGPGWANQLVNVLYRDGNGGLSIERFQPDDQTGDMLTLFKVSEAASVGMIAAVVRKEEKARGRRQR